MSLTQIKWAALAAVAAGFAFTSTAVLGRQDYQKKDEPTKAAVKHFEPASDTPVPEKHVPRPARITTGGYAEPHEGRGNDPRSHRILARLEDPISMSFADRDAAGRRPQVHQAGHDDPDLPGHPDLRGSPSACKRPSGRSTRPSRSTSRASRCVGPSS